jgi:hypothetical protein
MNSDSWLNRLLASIDEMVARWREQPHEADVIERKLDELGAAFGPDAPLFPRAAVPVVLAMTPRNR